MSITEVCKSLSRKLGVYNAIRYSSLYHWVLRYRNPQYLKALNDDLVFYRKTLGSSLGLVFDVGANHGDKTWVFRQIARRVVSIEPDEACFAALRTRYGGVEGVALEHVALGEQVGTATFFVEENGSAYNTLSEKEKDWLEKTCGRSIRKVTVPVSTLDNMIAKYGIPDFLKIDVEGWELPVFNGLTRRVPIICFEANLPRFREETLCILERYSAEKSTRFNLRRDDEFVFSAHQFVDTINRVLNRSEEVTYDIFIFDSFNPEIILETPARGRHLNPE